MEGVEEEEGVALSRALQRRADIAAAAAPSSGAVATASWWREWLACHWSKTSCPL